RARPHGRRLAALRRAHGQERPRLLLRLAGRRCLVRLASGSLAQRAAGSDPAAVAGDPGQSRASGPTGSSQSRRISLCFQLDKESSMLASFTAFLITSAARLLTGARALWLG